MPSREPSAATTHVERGSAGALPMRWFRVGWLCGEWHGWRWKFGVACGPWYVGVLLGPAVVTVGPRQFFVSREQRWTIAWGLLDVKPPFIDGLEAKSDA